MTPVRPNSHPQMPQMPFASGDGASEGTWPTAMRALLLLSEAAHPGDPLLARLSDDDLALLRASMARLAGAEPTSAA